MRSLLALLVTTLCAATVLAATSQIDQIKRDSQFVVERFGPASRLASFGCNTESVDYLDQFLTRQAAIVSKDEGSKNRFISLFGSFLGECVVTGYGGKWVESANGLHIEVQSGGQVHIVRPFHKVARRVESGASESLVQYFRDVLPAALGPRR